MQNKNPSDNFKDYSHHFETLASHSDCVFWIRGTDYYEQIYVSPSYEKIWGGSIKELYANPQLWDEHILSEDRSHSKPALNTSPAEAELTVYRIIRPDGELRWIKERSHAIFDAEGKHMGYAGISQNITPEKQKEVLLTTTSETSEDANRAKTEFIANMSHDLKSPLHAIIGMAEILDIRKHLIEQKDTISGIIGSGQVILKLVNDILNFATIKEGKMEPIFIPFNLKALIQEGMSTITLQASQKEVKVTLSYSETWGNEFIGDPQAINRVFINLLSNALKFTNSGHIKVSVELQPTPTNEIVLKIEVEDTGIGIAEEHLPYIFDRFYRTDPTRRNRYKGTGLGLAIAHELVTQLKGSLEASSTLGKGSIFTCCIPLRIIDANIKAYNSLIKTSKQTLRLARSYRVLLVEDDVFAQKVSQTFLQQLGCRVELAMCAEEALNKLKPKAYDLIFMDLGLPDKSGLETTTLIRSTPGINQSTPIIGLTAHSSPGDELKCRNAGMNDFITKPASIKELYDGIIRVKSAT